MATPAPISPLARRRKGRQSAGLASLGQKAKVTNSPFLARSPPTPVVTLSPQPPLTPIKPLERRKTVTFDVRPEVAVFEREGSAEYEEDEYELHEGDNSYDYDVSHEGDLDLASSVQLLLQQVEGEENLDYVGDEYELHEEDSSNDYDAHEEGIDLDLDLAHSPRPFILPSLPSSSTELDLSLSPHPSTSPSLPSPTAKRDLAPSPQASTPPCMPSPSRQPDLASSIELSLEEQVEHDWGDLQKKLAPTVSSAAPAKEKNHRYTLVEHQKVYVASDDKVSHNGRAGDLDRGRAWRSVKRPSDMNEYADEIRQINELREKTDSAHAKVFVKIVGLSDLTIPLQSSSQSSFRIALNNGLHSVETAAYPLKAHVDIGTEFELLGLKNLEFDLAVKVKKDNHITSRLRALDAPPPERTVTPTKKESGFRKLMGSPRRAPKLPPMKPAEQPPADELVRYLASDGTLATVRVVFKDIAARCNGQLLSLHLPMFGKWNDASIAASSRFANMNAVRHAKTIGRMELQIIMIPSLPGLTQDQLPQSLEDAVVGLRHVRWHKMDYHSGVLTQLGGDCSSWRRRQMRIVGGVLEATNDVTGKITARIDLSKMTSIRDYNAEEASGDIDRPLSVERSFGLAFNDGEEIQFFADKDEDKQAWISRLNELLGRVPSLPLWAEVLWVKQQQQQQTSPTS